MNKAVGNFNASVHHLLLQHQIVVVSNQKLLHFIVYYNLVLGLQANELAELGACLAAVALEVVHHRVVDEAVGEVLRMVARRKTLFLSLPT